MRRGPCWSRRIGLPGGLGRLALPTTAGPVPPLGFDPLRRHVQPHDAFVNFGHRRWWQVQLGLQEATGYGQQGFARAHHRSERRLVTVLDEPAWPDVGEPERASWGPVALTVDRRAPRRARPPERSMRHRRYPSPRARRRLPRDRAVPDPGVTIAVQTLSHPPARGTAPTYTMWSSCARSARLPAPVAQRHRRVESCPGATQLTDSTPTPKLDPWMPTTRCRKFSSDD